jgi:hypothetical protein
MTELSSVAIERLRGVGLDPKFAAALDDLVEAPESPGEFELICRWSGWPVAHRWVPGDEPCRWPDQRPSLWWPAGKTGSAVIITLGASSGLFLASVLFQPSPCGALLRRPNLPAVLRDAVPVCLPETTPGEAAEWTHNENGPDDLFGEIVSPALETVYLAIPKADPRSAAEVKTFVEELRDICVRCEVLPCLALLPHGLTWSKALGSFRGAGRAYALAGALELTRFDALTATTEGGDPP